MAHHRTGLLIPIEIRPHVGAELAADTAKNAAVGTDIAFKIGEGIATLV